MISGAAIMAQQLAESLAKNGHDILVLAASDKPQSYRQADGNLCVVRLLSLKNPTRKNQRFSVAPLATMKQAIAQFQPELIHLHDPLSLGLCGLHIASKMGVPSILTLQQLPWFPATYLPSWPWLTQLVTDAFWQYGTWLLQQCTTVTVPANTIADIVYEHTKIYPVPIYNGIDVRKFSPVTNHHDEKAYLTHKYGLDSDTPIVLHVGRLDRDKQVDSVLKAFAGVIPEVNAQLLVVGDGRLRSKLIKLSRELGIESHCHFPGYVCATADLPGLYRIASLFVTASEIELLPLVVAEAMASGLPVVAVSATSLPEMIESGIHGYLVPRKDYQAFSKSIIWLLQHPDEARQMGKASCQKASRYDLSRIVPEYENLYTHYTAAYACFN